MLLTCRSSVSVDFLVYIKNFLVLLFILLHWLTRSHALRGEPFQIQDFLGGIQNRRHFVPTIFLHPNPISFFGGMFWTKFECILSKTLMMNESFRHCLAEPRQPRKKNTLSFFKRNFTPAKSEMQGVFFFRGSAFQVFRQVAEQCGRSFGKTIFWGKDLPKLRLICF